MKLAEATWPEVEGVSREAVVLIPTGSLEQHGPGLPLSTDTLVVTAIAQAVEEQAPDEILLTPTIWLGASEFHLAFPGTLSANPEGYVSAIEGIVNSLLRHGFRKFYLLNGHGGNQSLNDIAMRKLRTANPDVVMARAGYFAFCEEVIAEVLTGQLKEMRHACEAETSLVMHLRPDLVRQERLRVDGLLPDPPVIGPVHRFDEISEQGSVGYAPLGTSEKGRVIFEAAVAGVAQELATIANGYVFRGIHAN